MKDCPNSEMIYESNDCSGMLCPTYIKIPSFLIKWFTPFFIVGLIFEITTLLNFIPVVLQIRTALWANQINQIIFWPIFILSFILFYLSIKNDVKVITKPRMTLYLTLLILTSPVIILAIEPYLFYSEVALFIPTDFTQTRKSEQKFESIDSEVRLLSLSVCPAVTPLTTYLKERKLRSLNIQMNSQYNVDFEKFFPFMWMTFVCTLIYVLYYNLQIYHWNIHCIR